MVRRISWVLPTSKDVHPKKSDAFSLLRVGTFCSAYLTQKLDAYSLQKASTESSARAWAMLHDETSCRVNTKINMQWKSDAAKRVAKVLNRLSEKNRRGYHRFNCVSAFAIEANAIMLTNCKMYPQWVFLILRAKWRPSRRARRACHSEALKL